MKKKKPLKKSGKLMKAAAKKKSSLSVVKRTPFTPAVLVRDCMTEQVEVANPEISVAEAARKMKDGDFGILPLGESDRLVGMITDRDIVVRAVAVGKNPDQTKAREVMTDKVLYCYDDETIEEVAENMGSNQVKRLPVLNREKRLVGILSLGDLAQSRECSKQVKEALTHITEHEHREPRKQAVV